MGKIIHYNIYSNEFFTGNTPKILKNNFPNFDKIKISYEEYFSHISSSNKQKIPLVEFDAKNLQKRVLKKDLKTAVELINNNNLNKKYAIVFQNLNSLRTNDQGAINIPHLVTSNTYKTTNLWYGQQGYITQPHFDTVPGVIMQLKGKKNFF